MAGADKESERYMGGIGTGKRKKKNEATKDETGRAGTSKALRVSYFACPAVIKSKIESK